MASHVNDIEISKFKTVKAHRVDTRTQEARERLVGRLGGQELVDDKSQRGALNTEYAVWAQRPEQRPSGWLCIQCRLVVHGILPLGWEAACCH